LLVAGIDSGLYATKVVLMNNGEILSKAVLTSGLEDAYTVAERALKIATGQCALPGDSYKYILATGQGKSYITFADESAPDSICLARAVYKVLPSVHTILDIGAAHTLVVKCSKGIATGAVNSDKCAAGTGTYLEIVSAILGVPFENMGGISLKSTEKIEVNSLCAVFAESEIISLVHSKKRIEDILRGVYRGLALRLYSQLSQVGLEKDIALVGGMAQDIGLRSAIEALLGHKIMFPEDPITIGALGAAIVAEGKVNPGK
jgi:predicted CoA-substrate-specific enzyme activase